VREGHALELAPGDQLRLRKPHPCGSRDWRVRRVGADIGLVCLGCGHAVLLSRAALTRQVKTVTRAADRPGAAAGPDA
jgi:hypothetical protein